MVSLQREAEILLAGCEFEVESRKVLELVRDSDCSAYDCEFIALAMKLDTKVFTMDKKLLRAFPNYALSTTAANDEANRHFAVGRDWPRMK